jgi:hypothetical protein
MNFDQRFYGVYEGIVVNNNDPENLGRVTLQVPQVTGSAETNWAAAITGGIAQNHFPYGTFTTVTDQFPVTVDTEKLITYELSEDTNKIYRNGTRIYVEESGDYSIFYSNTFASTNSSAQTIDVWFKLNGQTIPRSSTRFIISGNPSQENVSKGGIIDLNAGDYLEIAFQTSNINIHLAADPATNDAPVAAGGVFTIFMVGKYRPKPGTKVGVMYLAGDPNFPLWTGEIA